MRGEPGFFDFDDRLKRLSDLGDQLKRLSDLGDQLEAFQSAVDFEIFRADLLAALNPMAVRADVHPSIRCSCSRFW